MKKTLVAAVAAFVLGLSQAQAADPVVSWRMPAAVPEGSFFYNNFMQRFADNTDRLTAGRVKIQPFGAGVVVPAFKVYESVQDGVVEAGHSTPSFLVNADPTNAIFASFPGGMGPEGTLTWLYEAGGEKLLQDFRKEKMGLHSMVVGVGTSEIFAHSNKPIRTVDDLKGLKYRTSGAWATVLKDSFGAVPTVVPPGEIYTLLQRKGVDAVEWATPSANMSEGFHEVAPYLILPGVHQPSFVWEVVVKQDTWNKVPDDLKSLITAAAKLTTYESLSHFAREDVKAMEVYRKTKVEIITLDDKSVGQLRAAGRQWALETASKRKAEGDATMSKVLDSYLGYQNELTANSSYLVRDGK
ncbi:TRAP transporter substrate-binding protein DctP [Novispirillum itersonii]|uniref:TRAP transporter substrate-binding protein DctP n=1 Tax=Novispirillum itersonii TaxID=189 RepID=UPI00036E25CC|nr:TRAP transporter substrate-binding protein DctP [Novispirillum itersonii]